MISVAEAKTIIAANAFKAQAVQLSLRNALGLRLAADIYSPADVPAYPQSSMDGYAFSFADFQNSNQLIISGEMQAGSKENFILQKGSAARIFTGAPLPQAADTVIMQEKTTVKNGVLLVEDEKLQMGNSVRATGSAIKAGALALPKNSLLSPGAIGFLTGMGITEVSVFAAPPVGIVVTGNELQQPGQPLAFGEVYESNSFSLQAALQQLQITNVKMYSAADDLKTVTQVLQEALAACDIVLLTGGVSVGDYDFVVAAAAACGVDKLFHRIKQRPGKPLYFGCTKGKIVFGLPGNPSSVLTCFYEYVLPALGVELPTLSVPLARSVTKPAGLTHFLKARFNGTGVEALDAQESYRMSSFAVANCLIMVPEEVTFCKEGTLAEIHLLPF